MKKDKLKIKKMEKSQSFKSSLSSSKPQVQQKSCQNSESQSKQIQQSRQQSIQNSTVKDQDQVKTEVKIQQLNKKWYEQQEQLDQYHKWDYLEHHGVVFPDPYQFKSLSVSYRVKVEGTQQIQIVDLPLTAYQQELAWYWCQTIGTQWQQNSIYRTNFSSQFLKRFKKYGYKDFQALDFSSIKSLMIKLKQQKKNISQKQKDEKKKFKQNINKNYGFAMVDGLVQRINGFMIEPPTLFKGRGKHPKAGILKPRIEPEEVMLNISQDAPIPKCHVPGHNWLDVVTKRDSTWLCHYNNDAVGLTNANKYIMLAANSRFKGISDRRKYQKARKLKNCIQNIREDYKHKIYSKDLVQKQLGTAVYLIDMLALRVGNQKGEDEADTVGCCSLRVQHVELQQNDLVKLDFLGKDSMRYQNTVEVDHQVWSNLQIFKNKKRPGDSLFHRIDAGYLNEYLKQLMQGLTAKVFRTYNASVTLQQQLSQCDLTNLSMEEKFQKYEFANKQVAILCNHQKTVGKRVLQTLSKKQLQIDALKAYLKQLRDHKSKINVSTRPYQIVVEFQGGKKLIKKFQDSKQGAEKAIQKLSAKIEKQTQNLRKRDEGKSIALGTSKTNYNDPRISVAWCKKNGVKIQKVFTKNLLSKFVWAMHTNSDWQF